MNKQNYPDIQETVFTKKLENGLTVCLMPRRDMSKTFALFTTNYGSIDQTFVPIGESEEITVPEGIAHFLEHKLFEKEDRDVFADFGKQGASPNAYTSFTKTAYLFSATSQIEKNVETLLDFVQDPFFSEQSVEKEKGIIAQEINMYDDQADWRSFMGTIQGLFQHHPVNIDIAGTVESIQSITKDDLYTCYHTFYHPENMILSIAGNFDEAAMMELIKENQRNKQFDKMAEVIREEPDEPANAAKAVHEIHMPVSIAKCTVGIKEAWTRLSGETFLKKDMLQDMVMTHFFSKGGSFYQALYEENFIDDSFYYETNLDRNFGYSMIGSNTDQPDAFADRVKQLLLSTKEIDISDHDAELMKRKKIGQLLRSMNSLEYLTNKYTHYQLAGVELFDLIPQVQSFTTDDIRAYVQDWIDEERLTVCKITAG
ncbi:insulinase family protein [Ornithinibacillus gellani]|uniref:EF-P 5-aminopentanol modification-associated protein YfmH n=1 Tax=Ornithinibacillus gellani TaxID=2293253 RepID=UPI000F472073|nr:pitrilysin family protein [Ornithinibacillus gellani]TQS75496.1 insulinase family protein [Ornithinibacillus gellani]